MCPFQVIPLGDSALVLQFADAISEATHAEVHRWHRAVQKAALPGVVECVPTFTALTVYFNPWVAPAERLGHAIRELAVPAGEESSSPTVEIPVRYGGKHGPDLDIVAEHCGLSPEEVIALHSAPLYLVHMIGFAPGFPYLGGMDPRLTTPRKASPRTKVPAGSVGIAHNQTGVYPFETPGGWQIVGHTTLKLFDPRRSQPSLLKAGDRVRFVPA